MKRKLCSVLLALCMVLTLLPVSAMAEGDAATTVSTKEALSNAIASANDGDTITVSGEIAVDAPLKVTKSITLTGGSIVASDNFSPTSGYLKDFNLISLQTADKTLTLKNITLNARQKTLVVYCDKGKIVVDGATITGGKTTSYVAGVYMTAASQFEMNSGSITGNEVGDSSKNDHYTQYASDLWVGANATGALTAINGGTVGNIFVNSNEWSASNPGSFTMSGGYVDNIYVEYDNGYGAAFTYTDGTINHLYLSTTTSGKSIEVSPVKGTAYKGGVPENPVAQIGASYYATLAAAISAANSGDTVKLLADTTETVTVPADKTVTLDLNGHKLVNSDTTQDSKVPESDRKHTITNNGTLTIEDSVGGGVVDNVSHGRAALYNNGTITEIKGGKFTRSVDNSTDAESAKGNSWYVVYNAKDATISKISGGDFLALGHFSSMFCNSEGAKIGEISGGTFTQDDFIAFKNEGTIDKISGGTFSSKNESCIQNWGTIGEITNGTITAGSIGIWNLGSEKYKAAGTVSKITGGNISGTTAAIRLNDYDISLGTPSATNKANASISAGNFSGALEVNANTVLTITGGAYSVDPTAYVADGSIARVNSDGTFTVVAKTGLKNGTYTTSPEGGLASGYSYYQDGDYYTVYRPAAPSTSTSTTTTNPDGSTTTTTTDKATGTVTETTKNTDGSTTTVETKKDGSVTETNKTANGSVGTVKSDANGNSEISASISAADVSTAEKKNEPVAAPVSVAPAATSASAPVIKLSVPASAGEVSVVIPVTNAQQGTVAVKVNPDGTEEIIKTSVVTENGVVLGVEGNAQIKIVNNDKDFVDTVGHWAESDVDFVSARELFTGTAPQTFSPEDDMTRGMVVTVLARLAGASTDGGANWYDKGCEWAVTNGVSDGSNPNGSITREQLAAMLYRYFGSPAVSGSLNFTDASAVSEYAHDAMLWCVNSGIINGMDGLLNPQSQATRAQVSAMFARYIRLMASK